jgi:hypothetical protein
VLNNTRYERVVREKRSSLSGSFVSYEKMKGFEYHIHNTSFSSQLTNGPNKLECYITLGMEGFLERNTLAYMGDL